MVADILHPPSIVACSFSNLLVLTVKMKKRLHSFSIIFLCHFHSSVNLISAFSLSLFQDFHRKTRPSVFILYAASFYFSSLHPLQIRRYYPLRIHSTCKRILFYPSINQSLCFFICANNVPGCLLFRFKGCLSIRFSHAHHA